MIANIVPELGATGEILGSLGGNAIEWSRETKMGEIHKKIVTDEDMNPVAVQIEYDDWLAIEQRLNLDASRRPPTDLSRHAGRVDWPVDGIEYQHQIRSEWD